MNITVNGEKKNIENPVNLRELLEKLNLPNERIAVELNKQVVRKKDWNAITVNDDGQNRNNPFCRRRLDNYELRITNYELRIESFFSPHFFCAKFW